MPDIQLLAQIFNDNYISGSQLDNGNNQSAYPKAVLPILELALRTAFTTQGAAASTSRQQDHNPLGLFSREDITKIAAETKIFIAGCEQIVAKRDLVSKLKLPKIPRQYYSSPAQREEDRSTVQEYIGQIKSKASQLADSLLDRLKDQQTVYVPGGWIQDRFGGHALVYKISRIGDDHFTFEIFNTGAGLSNHSQQDSSLSVGRYKSLHSYRVIGRNTWGSVRFCLIDLLEFKLHDVVEFKKTYESNLVAVQEKKTHAELLYDAFLTTDDNPVEVGHHTDYIRSQFSGTCAIRSFDLMLRDLCKTDDSILSKARYLQLKFFIKTKVLEQYLDLYSQNPLSQVAYDQITSACQNFSWAVTKQSRLMAAERFESIYGSPKYVRSLIETHQLKSQLLVVEVRPHQPIDFSKLPEKKYEVSTNTINTTSLGYKSFDITNLKQILQQKSQGSANFSMHAYVIEINNIIQQGPYLRYEMMHLLENMHDAAEKYILPETFEELSDIELDAYIKLLTIYIDVCAYIYGSRLPSKIYAVTMGIVTNILSKPGYYVFKEDFGVLKKQLEIDRVNPSVTTLDHDADVRTYKSMDDIRQEVTEYTLFHDEIQSLVYLSQDTSEDKKDISACLKKLIRDTIIPPHEAKYFRTDYQILYYYFIYGLCRSNEREEKLSLFPTELVIKFRKMLRQYDRQIKLNLVLTLSFIHPEANSQNRNIVNLCLFGDENNSIVTVHNILSPVYADRSPICGQKNRLDTKSFNEIENKTVKHALWLSTRRFYSHDRRRVIDGIKINHNILECFASEEFKSSSQQPSALSIIRLGYPHTSSDRAVNTLFSLFTGQDTLLLAEQDYQLYFEQILFTPEYMYKYFSSETSDLKEQLRYLNSVLEHYMQFFDMQHHADNKTFVFIMRMMILTNLYALKIPQSEGGLSHTDAARHFAQLVTKLDESNIVEYIDPRKNEIYELDVLRFLVLTAQSERFGSNDTIKQTLRELFLKIHFETPIYDGQLNINTQYLLDLSLTTYHQSHTQSELVSMNQELRELTLQVHHCLPTNLLNNRHFIKIFTRSDSFTCEIKNEGLLIEFTDKSGAKFRAIKQTIDYVIQREYGGRWYEYITTNQFIDQSAGDKKYQVVPKFMADSDHLYWMPCDESLRAETKFLCFAKGHKEPSYRITPNLKIFTMPEGYEVINLYHSYLVDADVLSEHMKDKIIKVIKILSRFEGLDFIKTRIDHENKKLIFTLVRYDLEFVLYNYDAQDCSLQCETFTGYSLDLFASSDVTRALGGCTNYLLLKSTSGQDKILLPKQTYKPSKKSNPDITWAPVELEIDNSRASEPYVLTDYDLSADYRCSAHYFTFSKNEQGAISANNTVECLYLSYITLGQNNIDLALYYINQCVSNGGLKGSADELRWVNGLLNGLERSGLDYVTIRCRVLILVANFMIAGHTWQTITNTEDLEVVNKIHTFLLINYKRYLQVLNKIPCKQKLTLSDELQIISLLQTTVVDPENSEYLNHRFQALQTGPLQQAGRVEATIDLSFYRFDQPRLVIDELISKLMIIDKTVDTKYLLAFSRQIPELVRVEHELQAIRDDIIKQVNSSIPSFEKLLRTDYVQDSLNIDLLIQYYLENKIHIFNFDTDKTQQVYQQIEKYLKYKIAAHALALLRDQVSMSVKAMDSKDSDQTKLEKRKLLQLLNDIKSILSNDQTSDRALIVYQASQKVCLRQKQLRIINDLKQGHSKLTQMIMGGGKTKVLMPILAQHNADGKNLSLVVVPKPLFETNLADLNKTSMESFGQSGKGFTFKRSDAATAQRSKLILEFLQRTIQNRDYIITTPESVQSVELKYFELLDQAVVEEADYQEWSNNLSNLEQILKILKQKSNAIVDEADISFDIRKELQYAAGEPVPYDSDYISYTHQMFAYLNKFDDVLPDMKLIDIIYSNQDIDKIILSQSLLQKLMLDHGPIANLITSLSINYTEVKKEIELFLSPDCRVFPDIQKWQRTDGLIINQADIEKIQKFLAFYKIQINNLLPSTLNRKHNQHYGLPNLQDVQKQSDCLIAVPYEAAKKPKIGSRFSNMLEELNYTYQISLLSDVPFDITMILISELHRLAVSDRAFSEQISLMLSSCSSQLLDVKFHELDLKDTDQMAAIAKALSANAAVRLYCVTKFCIAKQTNSTQVLSSTAITHADIYKTCHSMTGTPWNYQAMHPRVVSAAPFLDPSSDLEVVSNLNNKIKTNVNTYVNSRDDKSALASLFSHKVSETRCLIDIAGAFKDSSNYDMACNISDLINNDKIKYILYFDINNNLCALNRAKNKILKLPNTNLETMQRILQCTPEDYFTYYDQQHTTGVDIKQMPYAHALLTVDAHTLQRDILQGAMRMRQLSENQKITIVVNQGFKDTISPDSALTSEVLLEYANQLQDSFVQDDKTKALKERINNVYAQGLYRIVSLPMSDLQKRVVFKQLSDIYATYLKKVDTDFTRYFLPIENNETSSIVDLWAISLALVLEEESELLAVRDILSDIKAELQGFDLELQTTVATQEAIDDNFGQSLEQQVEQVVEKTLELETDLRKVEERHLREPHKLIEWPRSLHDIKSAKYYSDILTPSLRTALGSIKYSQNFINICVGIEPLQFGSKPVHQVAFHKIEGVVQAVIVTAQESLAIQKMREDVFIVNLAQPELPDAFLENDVQRQQYQELLAKAYFINGNIDLAMLHAPHWMEKNRKELYILATKHLKNVRYSNQDFVLALESEQLFAKFKRSIQVAPSDSLKKLIDEFTKDCMNEDELAQAEIKRLEKRQRTKIIDSEHEYFDDISKEFEKEHEIQQAIEKAKKKIRYKIYLMIAVLSIINIAIIAVSALLAIFILPLIVTMPFVVAMVTATLVANIVIILLRNKMLKTNKADIIKPEVVKKKADIEFEQTSDKVLSPICSLRGAQVTSVACSEDGLSEPAVASQLTLAACRLG